MEIEKPAVFKGSQEGIVLYLNPSSSFQEIIDYLNKTLGEQKMFFSGASLLLDANGKILEEKEINSLEDLFKRYGVGFQLKGEDHVYAKEEISKNLNEKTALVIPTTLRSGQVVKFDGDIVILGDVNEGAEVQADGGVYVFGIIRGIVASGDKIVSLGFQPLRMTIGKKLFDGIITDKSYRKPRVAELQDGEIVFKVIGEKKSLRGKE
jgi:septum site-determining protein MinC